MEVLEEAASWDLDAEWAAIARDIVPGFAGYYRDESGEYVVSTTQPARAEEAREVARARLEAGGRSNVVVRTRLVQYPWDQLKAWRDDMLGVMDPDDIFWLNISVLRNRLVFGVRSIEFEARIREEAARHGIPDAAVMAVEAERPVPAVAYGVSSASADPCGAGQSIVDCIRPVVGGLATEFPHPHPSLTTAWGTLGFNAYRGKQNGFVTASHNSAVFMGLDGTPHHQNDLALPSHRLGVETADPPAYWVAYQKLGRPSDAAFYVYDAGVSRSFGHIARTLYPGVSQAGSLIIDTAYPAFRITGKAPNSAQVLHEPVHKVGRWTGWTQGQIIEECVLVYSPPDSDTGKPGRWLPCQFKASLYGDTGDSGSPVFQRNGPLEPEASHVTLWGVLHMRQLSTGSSWYSPISAIEQDLGTLEVACNPAPAPCNPPVFFDLNGPEWIPQTGSYTWTAGNFEGGDGSSYTVEWYQTLFADDGMSCTWQSGPDLVGTGPSLQLWVQVPRYDFELQAVVTSGGSTAFRIKYVYLSQTLECPW